MNSLFYTHIAHTCKHCIAELKIQIGSLLGERPMVSLPGKWLVAVYTVRIHICVWSCNVMYALTYCTSLTFYYCISSRTDSEHGIKALV